MDFSVLLHHLRAPSLYEKSPHPFWDDEHISKGMLEAHLNPEWDAASRNARFIDRSAAWIAKTLSPEKYPSLLDLGCGPGLYAERFFKAGYAVTGVDLSPRSIAYAREKARREGLAIDYHVADYLSLDLPARFDAATMIYCDYGALPTPDRAALLRRAKCHLRTGGRLLMDVSTISAFDAFRESESWSVRENGGYWSEKPHLLFERERRFSEYVTLHEAHILTDGEMKTYFIWHTYFTLDSLRTEAEKAGFALIAHFGDVAGSPATDASPTLAVLLEKRDGERNES